MIRLILSLLFGILPQALYFMLYLSKIKQIKNRRLILLLLIFLIITGASVFMNYNLYLYIAVIPMIYLAMKLLYRRKVQIIDLFIVAMLFAILMIISFVCSFVYKNNANLYGIAYIINNILLFSTLALSKLFEKFYKFYCNNWNRKQGNKIKSITLRNISLISMNILIFVIDVLLIKISS